MPNDSTPTPARTSPFGADAIPSYHTSPSDDDIGCDIISIDYDRS